jgi:arsenate reductase (glutaredoxin)
VDLPRGLTGKELDQLIGKRDYRAFLNPKNELYRERNMKESPPSRAEAIRLMAEHPNLVRRPIVIDGQRIVLGWDEEAIAGLVSGGQTP